MRNTSPPPSSAFRTNGSTRGSFLQARATATSRSLHPTALRLVPAVPKLKFDMSHLRMSGLIATTRIMPVLRLRSPPLMKSAGSSSARRSTYGTTSTTATSAL
eukprot:1472479-Pleurochrysis_carterae.AAC.1